MPGKLEFNLRNSLKDVSDAFLFINRFIEESGIPEQKSYVLNLVYEELATNVVKYGFDDNAEHQIKVVIEAVGDKINFTIMDDGHEFNPWNVPAPDLALDLLDREVGGIGLHLVRSMAGSFSYSRENGWNIVNVQI